MDHKQVWSICTILINFCRKEECFLGPTKIRPTNVEGRTRKGCPWMIMQVDCRATGLTQTPLNLWKATSISMRPFKIPGFRNSQSFKPSLHKWITMDDTHAALYISLHIYMYYDPGRTSTPLDWKCTSNTCCLTQQNHMPEAFTFTNERERLRKDFCSIQQLSCIPSHIASALQLRQGNDVWTSCCSFDDFSEDPCVLGIPTPCG